MSNLYFDTNATTPMAPVVKKRMASLLEEGQGNPSSVHSDGRQAREMREGARGSVARFLDCLPSEVVFTSGATEGNNTVFHSVWEGRPAGRNKIITTTVEHDSVFKPVKNCQQEGAEIVFVKVNRAGELDTEGLLAHLDDRTLLVSVMLANNETGIIFPVAEVARMAHDVGALVHCDAACAVGKMEVSFRDWGVDFLSFSAHKFYGPTGIGALLVKEGVELESLLLGGAQEGNRRGGTENLLGIVGMAEAFRLRLKILRRRTAESGDCDVFSRRRFFDSSRRRSFTKGP